MSNTIDRSLTKITHILWRLEDTLISYIPGFILFQFLKLFILLMDKYFIAFAVFCEAQHESAIDICVSPAF